MRTTLTLDSDVEALVRTLMRERGISFKEAVNSALREALSPQPRADYVFPTFDMGRPMVDLTHALSLAGQLEDDETAHELTRGR